MKKLKRLAFIAHDTKKKALVNWCTKHKEILKDHVLVATGTTGMLIKKETNLPIQCFASGAWGGDSEIAAAITNREIDILIFFVDPLSVLPHEPDERRLMQLACIHNVVFCCNSVSADFAVESKLWPQEVETKYDDEYFAFMAPTEQIEQIEQT